MAVNKEIWQPLIIEELFKSNDFLNVMHNGDEYVVGGRIVHIPNSGGPSSVQKNRSVFPATVTTRSDNDVIYPLHEYTTDPKRITNIDQVELSYDKMASIIREDTAGLMESVAENILYDVSVNVLAGSKVPTTGASAAATTPAATGLRKILTKADIQAAKKILNKQSVPQADRYLVVDADMLDQLMSDQALFDTYQRTLDISNGKFGKLFGFNIIERATALVVDASIDLKVPGAAGATTDGAAALFFHKSAVERAIGEINVFSNPGEAIYYGDVISFLVRAGSRNRRADNKGFGIIYQDTP